MKSRNAPITKAQPRHNKHSSQMQLPPLQLADAAQHQTSADHTQRHTSGQQPCHASPLVLLAADVAGVQGCGTLDAHLVSLASVSGGAVSGGAVSGGATRSQELAASGPHGGLSGRTVQCSAVIAGSKTELTSHHAAAAGICHQLCTDACWESARSTLFRSCWLGHQLPPLVNFHPHSKVRLSAADVFLMLRTNTLQTTTADLDLESKN
jgi:hypothetical protein